MAKRPANAVRALTPPTVAATAFVLFFIVTVLGGGSSRPDVAALALVRLAAIAAIVVLLLVAPATRLARARGAMIFTGLAAALIALQLVPLPPAFWTSLPGRERYAADALAGLGAVWRPISLTPDLTINTLFALLPPVAATLWALLAGGPGRRIALYAIALAALASAVLGLMQLATGPQSALRYYPITTADSAVGFLANRNHQAMFLALAIPVVAVWAGLSGREAREDGIVRSWIALAAAVFLLAMATITGSRGGFVLAVVASGFAMLVYWQLTRKWHAPRRGTTMNPATRFLPFLGAVIVVVILILLSSAVAVDRLLATDPLDEQRAQWIAPLLAMARAFFPVGAGFGSFDSLYRGFEPFELLQLTYLNAAHNDLLQLVIEGGIFGLALLAVFLIWWASHVRHAWRMSLDHPAIAYARLASITTGVAMIGSLFDYPLRTPLHAVIFAIGCVWLALGRSETSLAKAPLPQSHD